MEFLQFKINSGMHNLLLLRYDTSCLLLHYIQNILNGSRFRNDVVKQIFVSNKFMTQFSGFEYSLWCLLLHSITYVLTQISRIFFHTMQPFLSGSSSRSVVVKTFLQSLSSASIRSTCPDNRSRADWIAKTIMSSLKISVSSLYCDDSAKWAIRIHMHTTIEWLVPQQGNDYLIWCDVAAISHLIGSYVCA